MECRESLLFNCIGKQIFLDEFGICTVSIEKVVVNDLDIRSFYAYNNESKMFVAIKLDLYNFYPFLKSLFESTLAKRKIQDYGYSYTNKNSFEKKEVDIIKEKNVKIYLGVSYLSDNYGYTTRAQKEIVISNIKDVDKYHAWIIDDLKKDSLIPIDYFNAFMEKEAYYIGHGKVFINKIANFPNERNIVCEATDLNGIKIEIDINKAQYLFCLPYRKTIIDEIDDSVNELLLSPYVTSSSECPGVYNVYWKPVKDASRYIVTVYKRLKDRRVHRLADFDVDRNTFYLSLDKLIGDGFVFKISAEDRTGEIIAKSRGTISGRGPDYYGHLVRR